MRFFALNKSETLGKAVAEAGGFALDPHEEREFEAGEHKSRPLVSVRGHDVYVLSALNGEPGLSANDKLCRLLLFLATCREHGARRITALTPYLAYSRKDRQTKPHDPVNTRFIAQLIEAVGTDIIVTLDVHNLQAFENAFRCQTLHLDARRLFAEEIRARLGKRRKQAQTPVVFSPDGGGVKRAELLRDTLEEAGLNPGFGFMEKRRSSGVISGELFAGEVEGRPVFILDDMIVGGDTMLRAARACHERGAASVHLMATHALFTDAAVTRLAEPEIDSITVTDAAGVPAGAQRDLASKLKVLSVATLLGHTLSRLDLNQPIGPLLDTAGQDD